MKARDLFDLACVLERRPATATAIAPIYFQNERAIAARLRTHELMLREDFAALDVWEFSRSFDECVEIIRQHLGQR